MRLLRCHPTPREGGRPPLHCDRLLQVKRRFVIEWSRQLFGEEVEHVTEYRTYAEAIEEWEVFPRAGEEVVEKVRRTK